MHPSRQKLSSLSSQEDPLSRFINRMQTGPCVIASIVQSLGKVAVYTMMPPDVNPCKHESSNSSFPVVCSSRLPPSCHHVVSCSDVADKQHVVGQLDAKEDLSQGHLCHVSRGCITGHDVLAPAPVEVDVAIGEAA
jgi:hypothetical protein